ncbi:MAG: sporulation protein YqfD [Lachnospiraceae bacterium]|nr:sporulation protein YqfD [Lachnospiraceae bacterium]
MIDWLNSCRGYLRIRVKGFSPERFMNLCSTKGIVLWNITRSEEAYEMCIGFRNFYKLRPIVRKTGTKVVVLERYGLPFFMPRLRKRKMFVLGLVLAVVFWLWSSCLIWDIDYTGNYQITNDMMEVFLKEQNIHVGMRKRDLNIEEMEKEIRRRFTQITWTSAKLTGTKLRIDIKENDTPVLPVVEEIGESSNLVAEYSGRIVSMIVRKGVPKVHIGDEVESGTLLVEGAVPIFNEDTSVRGYNYVEADADIIMEHGTHFEEKLPCDYISRKYTGRTKRKSFLRVGEKEWRMPGDTPYLQYDTLIREERPVFLEKLSIPLYWGDYTHREYQNIEYKYTEEEAEEILEEKINTFLTTLEEKGVHIIEKDVKIDTNGDFWTIEGDFLVEEPVGVSVAISNQDNNGESESDE